MPEPISSSSRRDFLKTSGAFAAAPTVFAASRRNPRLEPLRVGLIGCGGRGTGAAVQALKADPGARLVALGDAFADRVEASLQGLLAEADIADRVDVPSERRFSDFDNFERVLDQDLDVVVLGTSPHFRPQHLRAAIEKGVHVFAEKPVACDAPGLREIRESCELAKQRGLSIVSGLCYRYHDGRRAIMREIHDGRIGEITSMNANYITGELWHRGTNPQWSPMEYQMRNWLYYAWLSGDMIAEQHIHSLDVMAWAMRDEYPIACVSIGGRQKRTDEQFGHVYDHFATIYEWANGVKGYSFCRQQSGCHTDVSDHIVGSEGSAHVFDHAIEGARPWKFKPERRFNMYQTEHDELFAGIRAGRPIHNGDYMCNSTMMAIMARMSAYTGQRITWEQAWNSTERLGPTEYSWGDAPVVEVAIPGITRFA